MSVEEYGCMHSLLIRVSHSVKIKKKSKNWTIFVQYFATTPRFFSCLTLQNFLTVFDAKTFLVILFSLLQSYNCFCLFVSAMMLIYAPFSCSCCITYQKNIQSASFRLTSHCSCGSNRHSAQAKSSLLEQTHSILHVQTCTLKSHSCPYSPMSSLCHA